MKKLSILLLIFLIPTSAIYEYPDVSNAYYSPLLGSDAANILLWDVDSYNFSRDSDWFNLDVRELLEIQLSFNQPFDLVSLNSTNSYYNDINISVDNITRAVSDDSWSIISMFLLPDKFIYSNSTLMTGSQVMIDQWLAKLDALGYRKDTLKSNVKLDDRNLAWIELWNETQYTFATINYQYGVVTQYFDIVNNEAIYFHLNPDSDLYVNSSYHFDYKPAYELIPGNNTLTLWEETDYNPNRTEYAFLTYPVYTFLLIPAFVIWNRRIRVK